MVGRLLHKITRKLKATRSDVEITENVGGLFVESKRNRLHLKLQRAASIILAQELKRSVNKLFSDRLLDQNTTWHKQYITRHGLSSYVATWTWWQYRCVDWAGVMDVFTNIGSTTNTPASMISLTYCSDPASAGTGGVSKTPTSS